MKIKGLLDKRKASCEETKKSNREEVELIMIPEKFLKAKDSIWQNQIMASIRINKDMMRMRK